MIHGCQLIFLGRNCHDVLLFKSMALMVLSCIAGNAHHELDISQIVGSSRNKKLWVMADGTHPVPIR